MCHVIAMTYYENNVVIQLMVTNVVPIIPFIFQFGFQKVWESDPPGFGILKCPSLLPKELREINHENGSFTSCATPGQGSEK